MTNQTTPPRFTSRGVFITDSLTGLVARTHTTAAAGMILKSLTTGELEVDDIPWREPEA